MPGATNEVDNHILSDEEDEGEKIHASLVIGKAKHQAASVGPSPRRKNHLQKDFKCMVDHFIYD